MVIMKCTVEFPILSIFTATHLVLTVEEGIT